MEIILKYFPNLTDTQIKQIDDLYDLYVEWNAKINVISRKDIEHLYLHHVLHSMVISKWMPLKDKTKILDVGCGGGFPSIPLAILYPEVNFHLVDSVRKKLTVVNEVSAAIDLQNVRTTHSRVEEIKSRYDFVIVRAVAQLPVLVNWTRKNISTRHRNIFPNGIIALKGGDLTEEIRPLKKKEYIEQIAITDYFEESYFAEKYIIYVQG